MQLPAQDGKNNLGWTEQKEQMELRGIKFQGWID
jgi:hypothetical protein